MFSNIPALGPLHAINIPIPKIDSQKWFQMWLIAPSPSPPPRPGGKESSFPTYHCAPNSITVSSDQPFWHLEYVSDNMLQKVYVMSFIIHVSLVFYYK